MTDICPYLIGGKDQQPAAFSPRTSLFYVPGNRLCMTWESLHVNYIEGTPFMGAFTAGTPVDPDVQGEFFAWNASTGTKAWRIPERFPVWSGALATAGDVVFYGTMDRFFKAVDARTGAVLFRTELDSGIVGYPMTFMGPDGRQRIAVYSGSGGALVPHTEFGTATDDSNRCGRFQLGGDELVPPNPLRELSRRAGSMSSCSTDGPAAARGGLAA